MESEAIIRRFKPSDIENIEKLWKEKPVVASGLLAGETNCQNWVKWILERYEADSDSVIIAERKGRVVGMYVCACSRINILMPNFPPLTEKNLIAWGSDWLVAPEERGKGIGQRLLDEAIMQAKSKGAAEFRGNVHPISARAERMHKSSGSTISAVDFARSIDSGLPHKQIQNLRIRKGYSSAIAEFFEPWLRTCAIGNFEASHENKTRWLEWARSLGTRERQGVLVAYDDKNLAGFLLGSAKENKCQGLVYDRPSGRIFGLVSKDLANPDLKNELLATFADYLLSEHVRIMKLFVRTGEVSMRTFLENLGFKPNRFMHTLLLDGATNSESQN